MKKAKERILLSPTNLSNHLGCKHLTELNREVVLKKRKEPPFKNLSLEVNVIIHLCEKLHQPAPVNSA